MIYSQRLQKHIKEIEGIISNWPVDIGLKKVIKWILQFDDDDIELAVRIIRNLNVIGSEEIDILLEIAYSKLNRRAEERGTKITNKNTVYAGMGEDGKSGSMISYHFRVINDISEENFLNEDSIKYFQDGQIENIVLIDDVLLTGDQASKNIREYTEKFFPLGVKNIFVLTLAGYSESIKEVEDSTSAYVFSAYEFGIKDTYKSLDSKFYDGIPHEMRETTRNRMESYGKFCSPRMPNGYKGLSALLAFYYNTPNATSPLIWSSNNGWIPLFKRSLRSNGVESYYKQLQKALENKSKNKTKAQDNDMKKELVIYTEGKRDEYLFEILIFDYDFTKLLDYEKITIIPLGGGYYSHKLMEKICETKDEVIFIFDEDVKRFWNDTNKPANFPIVLMKPSILFQCVDIFRFIQDYEKLINVLRLTENEIRVIQKVKSEMGLINKLYTDGHLNTNEFRDIYSLEKLIYIKTKNDRFNYILHEYFNREGYEILVSDIRTTLSNMR